jgi:hypothetical protein
MARVQLRAGVTAVAKKGRLAAVSSNSFINGDMDLNEILRE